MDAGAFGERVDPGNFSLVDFCLDRRGCLGERVDPGDSLWGISFRGEGESESRGQAIDVLLKRIQSDSTT